MNTAETAGTSPLRKGGQGNTVQINCVIATIRSYFNQKNRRAIRHLMSTVGLLPAPDGFAHVKADFNWHGRCWTRQRRIGSQRWDALTGLPPIGARIVKEDGTNE
jgi:hypothetical protein